MIPQAGTATGGEPAISRWLERNTIIRVQEDGLLCRGMNGGSKWYAQKGIHPVSAEASCKKGDGGGGVIGKLGEKKEPQSYS